MTGVLLTTSALTGVDRRQTKALLAPFLPSLQIVTSGTAEKHCGNTPTRQQVASEHPHKYFLDVRHQATIQGVQTQAGGLSSFGFNRKTRETKKVLTLTLDKNRTFAVKILRIRSPLAYPETTTLMPTWTTHQRDSSL